MKFSAKQVEGFAKSPPAHIRAILVYGPDLGLVRERIHTLSAGVSGVADDPFSKSDFTASALAKQSVRLVDEVLAISFGGGRRTVIVRDASEDLAEAVQAVLDNDAARSDQAALLIFGAGNLPPRSKLRKLFEADDECAALPCYPDDESGLLRLVLQCADTEGITISREAAQLAASLLSNDREANRREIEKLMLYAGTDGELSEASVVACLGDSSEASIDEAILASADGDYGSLLEQLTRVWADGGEPIAVIRSAQRHFQRLHLVLSQTSAGTPLDAALKQLRPPLFWRTAGRFRAQTTNLDVLSVETALARLIDAEMAAKSTGAAGDLVCDRALLSIAQLAKSRSRGRQNY